MRRKSTRKILLFGACIVLVLLIFFRNVIPGLNGGGDKQGDKSDSSKETILNAEAYRMLNYLTEITGETSGMMNCGEYAKALVSVCTALGIDYNALIENRPERLISETLKEEDLLYLEEFLFMYQHLIDMAEDAGVKTNIAVQHVYIYGYNGMPDKAGVDATLITSDGKQLKIASASDYSDVLNYLDIEERGSDEAGIENNDADISSTAPLPVRSSEERIIKAENCLDKSFRFLCSGDEIIYMIEETKEKFVLRNAWVVHGEEKSVTLFAEGITRELSSKTLSESVEEAVGDITLEAGKVVGIVLKQGMVNGKVLMTDEEYIEIEGYGKLPLDEHYRIYKIYDEVVMERTNSVLVGYSNANFIVIDGKICAILITQSISAKNIRVLIKSDGFNLDYHETVVLTSDRDFEVSQGEEKETYTAGYELTITGDDLEQGRIKITSISENGKITLLSVKRSYGNPAYRGSMEISQNESGLIIVNELSLEEYLYAVVPSEMPTSYGMEALKAQAVCARSYAYNHLMANKYSAYGAHVDDSVNCQVYNNVKEDENSIFAVKDTYGLVMESEGKVVTAYYFSTSFGHTASVEDVWENGAKTEYLTGNLQTEQKPALDLSNEQTFREFLNEDPVEVSYNGVKSMEQLITYDSGFNLYRWNVKISAEHLSSRIDKMLYSRYQANTSSVLTLVTDGEAKKLKNELGENLVQRTVNNKVFVSKSVKDVGEVKNVSVITRGSGGIIKELLIEGTKESVLICFQTNIRMLFAPINDILYRVDGTEIKGMTMLPSAFFAIDKITEKGETVFCLSGGGYGHGLGMSQNGAKTMAKQDKSFKEILEHYYPGITFRMLYI